jgi:hypothetical protein
MGGIASGVGAARRWLQESAVSVLGRGGRGGSRRVNSVEVETGDRHWEGFGNVLETFSDGFQNVWGILRSRFLRWNKRDWSDRRVLNCHINISIDISITLHCTASSSWKRGDSAPNRSVSISLLVHLFKVWSWGWHRDVQIIVNSLKFGGLWGKLFQWTWWARLSSSLGDCEGLRVFARSAWSQDGHRREECTGVEGKTINVLNQTKSDSLRCK